jgi:4'-phosphopantetheinyl transferase
MAERRASATIDLWAVDLRAPPPEGACSLLDPNERARAQRFVRPIDRQRFVHAHAALRRVLASYQDTPAERLAFTVGAFGKPRLADATIEFNAADTADAALIAVGRGTGPIGVDVESIVATRIDEAERAQVAARAFRSEEIARFDAAAAGRRRDFYRHWTIKEAALKAAGTGLSLAPQRIAVRWEGDDTGMVVAADGDAQRAFGGPWQFRVFGPDPCGAPAAIESCAVALCWREGFAEICWR